jgi:hypothetical protein
VKKWQRHLLSLHLTSVLLEGRHHHRRRVAGGGGGRAELTGRALLSSGAELDSDAAMVKVAKMVLELATEESLPISMFVGVATHPTLN